MAQSHAIPSQVAKTRTYTPTIDDVGYVLRYQVNIVDKTHAGYVDASKIQMFDTTRVRPAPNPPARHMVQLMAEPTPQPAGPSGRFTLLTYNLLADIYAKVLADTMHMSCMGRGMRTLACMHACLHFRRSMNLHVRPLSSGICREISPTLALHGL